MERGLLSMALQIDMHILIKKMTHKNKKLCVKKVNIQANIAKKRG
jgi:hypothetical protein